MRVSPLWSCSAGERGDVRQSTAGVGCVMRFVAVAGATRGWCIGVRAFYMGGASSASGLVCIFLFPIPASG